MCEGSDRRVQEGKVRAGVETSLMRYCIATSMVFEMVKDSVARGSTKSRPIANFETSELGNLVGFFAFTLVVSEYL